MRAQPLCGEQRPAEATSRRVNQQEAEPAEPLELSCHTIVVDTDDGYAPTLDAVTAEIDATYESSRSPSNSTGHPPWNRPTSPAFRGSLPSSFRQGGGGACWRSSWGFGPPHRR